MYMYAHFYGLHLLVYYFLGQNIIYRQRDYTTGVYAVALLYVDLNSIRRLTTE
jgi:hypothetical protein